MEKPISLGSIGVFQDADQFKHAQRVAQMLCTSDLAPAHFKGQANIGSAVIAVDMAFRLRMNPLMVMQQLYVVHGKPGWSAQFVIAVINASGRFTPLRFRYSGQGETRECVAYSTDIKSGELLEGTSVSIKLAKAEGWFSKAGSKWQSIPEQMLAYRAAAFWGRIYAPEMFMGLPTTDEIKDIEPQPRPAAPTEIRFDKPAAPEPEPKTEAPPTSDPADNSPVENATPEPAAPKEQTIQDKLGDFLVSNGVAFDDFRDWLNATGRMDNAEALAGFCDVPDRVCEALTKDTKALAKCVTLYGKKA